LVHHKNELKQKHTLNEIDHLEDQVKHRQMKWAMLIVTLAAIMMLGACKKKTAPTPPPPPPAPAPAPTATLTANPSTIEKGQSVTLSWQTTNADDVTLGPNKVDANGSASVSPTDSTTFRLVAKGAGGTQEATARVTVTQPAAPTPPPQPSATDQELFNQNVKDVYFDYDSYEVRPDAQSAIAGDAQFLQQHPNISFTVEGHCDERGSTEYNLALGDNRANAVKTALTQAGVPADRIKTISFGKEKPFCTESNEQCWQQNRRGHFVYGK
jgi:peptidoglycan-associated lipoprotein